MKRDKYYKSVFWYLTTVLEGTALGPDKYARYLETDNIKDYSSWCECQWSAVGLAAIIDFELGTSHKIEQLCNDFEAILERCNVFLNESRNFPLPPYRESMEKIHSKTKEIILEELNNHQIPPQQSEEYYADLLGYLGTNQESEEILPYFINFLNEELKSQAS